MSKRRIELRKAVLKGFTHITKISKQKCFHVCWWPHADKSAGIKEREYPLMMFESGQCNRVSASNIQLITK